MAFKGGLKEPIDQLPHVGPGGGAYGDRILVALVHLGAQRERLSAQLLDQRGVIALRREVCGLGVEQGGVAWAILAMLLGVCDQDIKPRLLDLLMTFFKARCVLIRPRDGRGILRKANISLIKATLITVGRGEPISALDRAEDKLTLVVNVLNLQVTLIFIERQQLLIDARLPSAGVTARVGAAVLLSTGVGQLIERVQMSQRRDEFLSVEVLLDLLLMERDVCPKRLNLGLIDGLGFLDARLVGEDIVVRVRGERRLVDGDDDVVAAHQGHHQETGRE